MQCGGKPAGYWAWALQRPACPVAVFNWEAVSSSSSGRDGRYGLSQRMLSLSSETGSNSQLDSVTTELVVGQYLVIFSY